MVPSSLSPLHFTAGHLHHFHRRLLLPWVVPASGEGPGVKTSSIMYQSEGSPSASQMFSVKPGVRKGLLLKVLNCFIIIEHYEFNENSFLKFIIY